MADVRAHGEPDELETPRTFVGLEDPVSLAPYRHKPTGTHTGVAPVGTELLQVVIETPRGSQNKYSYDEEQRVFVLKAALPVGMVFPFDFGFVPRTTGGDGDPLDVLVLMDAPAFPGCALLARLLGVMKTEQVVEGRTERNDRLVAVADATQLYRDIKSLQDIPEAVRTQLEHFFVNYHRLQGKTSRLLSWAGSDEAHALIQEGLQKGGKA